LNSRSGATRAIRLPANTPMTIGSHQTFKTSMSTAPRRYWARNALIEVGMITASEVPTHSGIRTSSGTPARRKHS
jgi:hypothetical protein